MKADHAKTKEDCMTRFVGHGQPIIHVFETAIILNMVKSVKCQFFQPYWTQFREPYPYTYTDFAIEIWGFYRRLTDTLRYHHTRCSRASGLLASICQHVYQVGRKVEFARSCLLFLVSFGKLRLSDQVQFIAWHGIQRRIIWIFSVKVKLVDSFI